jgi:hypothetical protein
MIITDREYKLLIDKMQSLTNEIVKSYNDKNTILGIIGEKFVGYSICHALWQLGYRLDLIEYPRSYSIQPRYGANEDGVGGIDYLLTIIDSNEKTHRFMIEVKNWGQYPISPDTFNSEILNRFTRVDKNHECCWMVTMNMGNRTQIGPKCASNGIIILSLPNQITLESIGDNSAIERVFINFIDEFSSVIRHLASEKSYPPLKVIRKGARRTKGVIQDLLMGVSYKVIEERYDVTRGYISRMASYIRSFNYLLPDRRKKDWRILWEVQD